MPADPNQGLSTVFEQQRAPNNAAGSTNGMTGIKPEDIYAALASMQGLFGQPGGGGGRGMQPPYSQVAGQAALAQNVMQPAGMLGAPLPGLGQLLGGMPMGPRGR